MLSITEIVLKFNKQNEDVSSTERNETEFKFEMLFSIRERSYTELCTA